MQTLQVTNCCILHLALDYETWLNLFQLQFGAPLLLNTRNQNYSEFTAILWHWAGKTKGRVVGWFEGIGERKMFCGSHPNLTLNHALYPSKGKRNPTTLLPSLSAQSKETSCSLCLKYVGQFACKRLKMVYSFHHLNPWHLPSDRRMLLCDLQNSFYSVQWVIVDVLLVKKSFLVTFFLLFFCACWRFSFANVLTSIFH